MSHSEFLFTSNELCIDFVNTRVNHNGHRVELIHGMGDLMNWMTSAGVVSSEQSGGYRESWLNDEHSEDIVLEAIEFRNHLERELERITEGKAISEAFILLVNEWLIAYPEYEQLEIKEDTSSCPQYFRSRSIHPDAGPVQMKAWIAGITADFLSRCSMALVHKCENPKCILYFYDTSKNHTRRWCSMNICGNRLKAAAHYQKKKKTTGGDRSIIDTL